MKSKLLFVCLYTVMFRVHNPEHIHVRWSLLLVSYNYLTVPEDGSYWPTCVNIYEYVT